MYPLGECYTDSTHHLLLATASRRDNAIDVREAGSFHTRRQSRDLDQQGRSSADACHDIHD